MGRRATAALALFAVLGAASTAQAASFETRSLDGGGNNVAHPSWGQAGSAYVRIAPARYADGAGVQAGGPNPRYVSNRVFNDLGQNLFSQNGVTQWGWTWGQFMDHTFGLAEGGGEASPIPFDSTDPLESFRNDLGRISFTRDAVAAGTGTGPGNPREQVNTVSAYIDGSSVYGDSTTRMEWLREGLVDGNLANNGPRLVLDNGFLPRANARGNAATAPETRVDGLLRLAPQNAVIAGDVRANENIALTATHTLFAREHNRIVVALPVSLGAEERFEIARRVVGAEQQYITYNEFLPALGVDLSPYAGYQQDVNAGLGNEFASVAYRAHSMIHGEFELAVEPGTYTPAELDGLQAEGVTAVQGEDELELAVPLNAAFFNPELLRDLGLGPVLASLSAEPQYRNDEQIDNALRSVLFQLPGPTAPDPAACFEDPSAQGCFQGVVDLGAIDVQRGRDHGMPTYNGLRRAVGLRPKRSFRAITGERTQRLPAGLGIDDPASLEFTRLFDGAGEALDPAGDQEAAEEEGLAISGRRRTTLAARLKATYGSVRRLDAFVGMVSEPHVAGTDMGRLQLRMWQLQFEALRDGDRFFYANDPVLADIEQRYGITYRHALGELIELNTDVEPGELPENVFLATGH
jgi:hypothetical protein